MAFLHFLPQSDNRTISNYVEDEAASLPAVRWLSVPENGSWYQAGGDGDLHSCSAQPQNRKTGRYNDYTSGNLPRYCVHIPLQPSPDAPAQLSLPPWLI